MLCPCVAETHVLRVRFRDGRWQDFAVTIGVTGTCAAGASPLVTPTFSPSPEPTTVLPTTSIPDPPTAVPQPTLLARPTHSGATPSVASPLVSPTPDAVLTGGPVNAMLSPLPSPTPVVPPTRATATTLGGAVMAETPPGPGKLWWALRFPCCLAQALLSVGCGSGSAVGSQARCQRRARTSHS